MKKAKRIAALAMVLALSLGSLTACGTKKDTPTGNDAGSAKDPAPTKAASADEPTTEPTTGEPTKVSLKVWGPQEEQASFSGYGDSLLAYMCEEFAKLHPEWDIEFTYGAVSEGDAKTELSKDATAAADVFMFASDQTASLVENGILAPITLNANQIIEANGGPNAGSITAATFNNFLYAVPFTPNSWFMYYDSSKYTEEEVQNLDTMMSKDLGDGAYNFAFDIDNGWYNASFFFAGGSTLFGLDGQNPEDCTFNNADGVKVGNYIVDLVTNNKFLQETDNGANAIDAFTNGKLGAWCSGTWNAENVKAALGDNYAATKLPTITIDGTDKQLKSFADYKYIGVNMNTQYMEAAQALATYLGGEECQKVRYLARSIAPTVTSLVNDPDVAANVAVAALSYQSAYTQFQSTIPQMANFWTPAEAFGAGCYNKEITKDNMQEQLDLFVDNVLTALSE